MASAPWLPPPGPTIKITIGFVTHSQGDPFIQQIIDGAQAAANDLGVTLKVAQQQGAAPDGQLKLVQNIVNAGAQGVATSVPGDSMANSLNDIIASGVPIVQFNLLSAAVKAPYVGEKSTQSGRISRQIDCRQSLAAPGPREKSSSATVFLA